MKSPLKLAALVAQALGGTSGRSSAAFIFDLSGVTFEGGGTLTGTFTTDDAITTLVSADLVSSDFGFISGFTYLVPGDGILDSLPTSFSLIGDSHIGRCLRLEFGGGLTPSGATLSTFSFEDLSEARRRVTAGSVEPRSVPEPRALALMAAGLPAVLSVARTRAAGRPGRSSPPRRGAG